MSSWASRTEVTRGLSRCGFRVPFRVPWRPFGTPDSRILGTLEAVLGHAEAVRASPLHEKMHVFCTGSLGTGSPRNGQSPIIISSGLLSCSLGTGWCYFGVGWFAGSPLEPCFLSYRLPLEPHLVSFSYILGTGLYPFSFVMVFSCLISCSLGT